MFLAAWAPLLADLRGARRVAVALFALPAALGAPLLLTRVLPALEPWLNAHAVAEAMQRVSPPLAPLSCSTRRRRRCGRRCAGISSAARSSRGVTPMPAARDGFVYAAYRPASEARAACRARAARRDAEVLARTPVLVLVRVSFDAATR
jgi:hypothetical protein